MDSMCTGWIGLSTFLLLCLLVMVIIYSYVSANSIYPVKCPKSIGNYGVIPGESSNALNTCDGECRFQINTLIDAVNKCDGDIKCDAFYYDGTIMLYIDPNGNFSPANPGGSYIRQRDIKRA